MGKKPERFYRISYVARLKRILIYQLFTYHVVSIKSYVLKSAGRIRYHFISDKMWKDCYYKVYTWKRLQYRIDQYQK